MHTVFSTENIHQRDRFEYWMDFVRSFIIKNDANPACRASFNAEMKAAVCAEMHISRTRSSALSVNHTDRHAKRMESDDVFIFMPISGQKVLEQDGRRALLAPCQFALIDPLYPHKGQFSEAADVLVVTIKRQKLESRLGSINNLTARIVRPAMAEGGLASAYLNMLPSHAGSLDGAAQGIVEAHALDLIALSLTKATDGSVNRTSHARSVVRMRLRAEIEARLSDLSLDAELVASAAGVSVKYANAILADEDTSIRRLLQEKRLARCREALEDPAQRHRSVSEIAYGWGFSDMTHFGRRFKAAYGLLPSECRRRAMSGAD
ncbi:helix-turn-helix domain-containing protein [Methylobacterium oryzisoli]|uniref:AraC-like ligand-binding domain-containing protein n=1 Tax=Methylobacterium oryzisoli TaxID=3385502 RepID=UPI003892C33F